MITVICAVLVTVYYCTVLNRSYVISAVRDSYIVYVVTISQSSVDSQSVSKLCSS